MTVHSATVNHRLVLLMVGALAVFAIGSSTAATTAGELRACVSGTGAWTDGRNGCANDNWVTWNTEGPAGPAGAQGAAGPPGPAGPQGDQGPAGSLPTGLAATLQNRLRAVQQLEARLAKAKPGGPAERALIVQISRAQRQTTMTLVAALTASNP